MFTSPILDIAITLVFVYFILAIIVSAFNEFVMTVLRIRASMLEEAIKNFIPDDGWKKICDKVLGSAYITSLQQKPNKFPSYIPAQNFALALTSAVSGTKAEFLNIDGLKTFINENVPSNSETQKLLTSLLAKSEKDFSEFQKSIEGLFNDSMDRLTGFYKRKVKKIIFFIALAISIALNVDTINITNQLWKNPMLAKATADRIHALATKDSLSHLKERALVSPSEAASKDTAIQVQEVKQKIDYMKEVYALTQEVPLPMGWVQHNYPDSSNGFDIVAWLVKLLGIFLTTFAISLGAPFWFDLLSKLVNMRNTGAKPETKTNP